MSETGGVFHVKQREGESVGGGSLVLENMDVVESVWSRRFVKMEVYWFWDWIKKEEIWNGLEDSLGFVGKDLVMEIHLYDFGWILEGKSDWEKGSC